MHHLLFLSHEWAIPRCWVEFFVFLNTSPAANISSSHTFVAWFYSTEWFCYTTWGSGVTSLLFPPLAVFLNILKCTVLCLRLLTKFPFPYSCKKNLYFSHSHCCLSFNFCDLPKFVFSRCFTDFILNKWELFKNPGQETSYLTHRTKS